PERPKVSHHASDPEKSMSRPGGSVGTPHDLAQLIDPAGDTPAAPQRPEVLHLSGAIEEGVRGSVAGLRLANHLTGSVYVAGLAVVTAERAKIPHPSVRPQKSMLQSL